MSDATIRPGEYQTLGGGYMGDEGEAIVEAIEPERGEFCVVGKVLRHGSMAGGWSFQRWNPQGKAYRADLRGANPQPDTRDLILSAAPQPDTKQE